MLTLHCYCTLGIPVLLLTCYWKVMNTQTQVCAEPSRYQAHDVDDPGPSRNQTHETASRSNCEAQSTTQPPFLFLLTGRRGWGTPDLGACWTSSFQTSPFFPVLPNGCFFPTWSFHLEGWGSFLHILVHHEIENPPPPNQQNDRDLWKPSLPRTTYMVGKKTAHRAILSGVTAYYGYFRISAVVGLWLTMDPPCMFVLIEGNT